MESSSSDILRPKYQRVFETLSEDIRSGKFKTGDKLPSEAALVKKFATSRIRVGRARENCSISG
jgi:GntR family transcriptional regulator of arabinose operon